MNSQRQRNGRGLILDNADVSTAAHISRDSIAQGKATVRGNARLLHGSCADEDCFIAGGTLDRAYVGGPTYVAGNALLADETIARCRAVTGNARVYHSLLEGTVEIFDDAFVSDVHLFAGVMIYGTARLIGPWRLGGFPRIHEGDWMRPPSYVELEHAIITECVADKLLIDCKCQTRSWWLRHGANFGRRKGWTEAMIEEAFEAVRSFDKIAVKPHVEQMLAELEHAAGSCEASS